jgi:hypothetical protein
VFLAQGRFSRLRRDANDLSYFGGCRTRASRSRSALKQLRRPRFVASLHGDALNTQAPLAKIDIRSESRQILFVNTGDELL